MFAILLAVLRYVFLLFLFVFIFGLVRWMINDLRSEARPRQALEKKRAGEKYGGRLTVTESTLPELIPGVFFGIGREMIIGRGGSSDVVINDSFTSTRHARVFVRDGQYWLEDLGSTNGTYLNGVPLKKPVVLADGDDIRVGGVTFQFAR